MDQNTAILSVLEELKEANQKQQKLLERQVRTTRILGALLACLVVVFAIFFFTLLPKLSDTIDRLNAVAVNTQQITDELIAADLEGTIRSLGATLDSVQDLVDENADSVGETLKKIEELDIDTLNKAIGSLYQVVNPLASLFGR